MTMNQTTTQTSITHDGTDSPSTMTAGTTVGKINVAAQRAKVEAQFTALVNGIDTELAGVTTFDFATGSIAKTDLVSKFSSRITAAEKTKAARLALHAAVQEEAQIAKQVAPYRRDMKAFLVSKYGKDSPKMQVFGFTQAKTPQKSAKAKAQGVAKARATREAVGPIGKKQRKAAAAAIASAAPAPAPAATPAPAPAPAPIVNK
jgi:hypothetical protein